MLEVKSIDVFYGNIQVLYQASISVNKGEIVSLIGGNGAGKSTLFKAIVGLLPKKSGDIHFDGQSISRLTCPEIIRLGMAVVPENRRLFAPLSVTDNLILGAYLRLIGGEKREVVKDLEAVYALFPQLKKRSRQPACTLSGGEQQMLAIGRALMARPKLILLDEPSLGLAPMIVQDIYRTIRSLKEKGNTILLIEQNARTALEISERAYLIELGRIKMQGNSRDLIKSDSILRLYLGA